MPALYSAGQSCDGTDRQDDVAGTDQMVYITKCPVKASTASNVPVPRRRFFDG